jgi:capsular exopolysaccharide synthesis family protein
MELRQYINVLIKWWWLILASVLVASTASLLGTLAIPRTYQSRTTLMVGQALQNPNPSQSDFYTGQSLAQSYADLVKREPILRAALQTLGLDWDWMALQGMITSRVVPGTQLLEIIVLDTDPQRAKYLVDEIVRQLIRQSPAGSNTTGGEDRQFIQQQVDDLKANITKGQAEVRQMDDVIAGASSARQIQDARSRQAALESQIATWQATYAQLMTNLQQGTTNFLSVVESAQVPGTSVSTSLASNVLLAAVIGFVLAGAAAFVLEYLDDTIKTSDDLRTMVNLASLGSVGSVDGDQHSDRLVTLNQPRSPQAEAYRGIRTNLQYSSIDRPLRSLLITSANPQEGKSLTAINLAIAFAQSGQRVILVDADMRRPCQHKILSLPNKAGLTSMLLDSNEQVSDVLQSVAVENLRVVTSGPLPPNPAEMLGSKRMEHLIESLQREADLVIFDSPPVLAVTDSIVLGTRVDGVLLVVEAGRTRYIQVRRSKEALTKVGAQLLGVVLNQVEVRSENYYSYYEDDLDSRQARRVRLPWSLPGLVALRARFDLYGRRQPVQRSRTVNSQVRRSDSTESQAKSVK